MKILSITNSILDPKSGSGKTVLRWSQGLQNLGHTVEVCEPKDYQILQDWRRAWKFRTALGAWQFFKRQVNPQDYDLIEFYGDEFWLILKQLAKEKERPFLVAHTDGVELLATERERAYNPPRSLYDRAYLQFAKLTHDRFSRIAFDSVDAFISGCDRDRAYVVERGLYPYDRTAVVELGLDPEYLAIPFARERQHRVVYLGSWTPRKGLGQLCTVMSNVLAKDPNLHFDLYGTHAPPEVVISGFPAAVREQMTIHPRLSNQDVAKGLARAKVFFFPSQYEGFGMATTEAMACGCAVVTTPTGFGADLKHLQDGIVCGFNDLEGMERGIFQLLEDETLREAIARAGYDRVQQFRWELAVKKLEQIYLTWLQA